MGMLGPMPSPAIAYLTQAFGASAGVVISASHNPFYDNGIKFFGADGAKLSDEVERAIEAELEQEFTVVESSNIGKVLRVDDAAGRYVTTTFMHYLESRMDDQTLLGVTATHDLAWMDGALRIANKRVDLMNCDAAFPSIQLLP